MSENNNEHLVQELTEYDSVSLSERYFGLSYLKFFILLAIFIIASIYMAILFFGENSLSVLWTLQDYEHYLQEEILNYKQTNAELQKQYFELKELEPEN